MKQDSPGEVSSGGVFLFLFFCFYRKWYCNFFCLLYNVCINLKFGKEPAQSLEIWALSRFVYIGYTVLFGGKLKKFLVA